jgi:predicted nucleic acid-binding protein
MKSLDTNILVYASNEDAPEYEKARQLIEALIESPQDWIVADQVLIETYRAVRNPAVIQRPLSPGDASALLHFYREEAGCRHCCYELEIWRPLQKHLNSARFDPRKTFDALLAVTLLGNAVDTFYTRNTKDFKQFGFQTLINPID